MSAAVVANGFRFLHDTQTNERKRPLFEISQHWHQTEARILNMWKESTAVGGQGKGFRQITRAWGSRWKGGGPASESCGRSCFHWCGLQPPISSRFGVFCVGLGLLVHWFQDVFLSIPCVTKGTELYVSTILFKLLVLSCIFLHTQAV